MMGWVAGEFPVLPLDGQTWSIAEAATVLDLSKTQTAVLRRKVGHSHVFPVGKRKSTIPAKPGQDAKTGRYALVYNASELIELIELLGLNGPKYSDPSTS